MNTPLSSAAMNPEANAADLSRKELQDKLNGLGGLSGRKLDPEAKAKKLREACEGFESIFIQKMWQEMRNAVPKGGLLQGKEEKFWQDMYDQELSKSMTKAGGIGLADMMYEQLSRNLVSASRSTAGLGGAGAFVPEAAPLVAPAAMEDALSDANAELAAQANVSASGVRSGSIYESEAPQAADAPEDPVAAQASIQPAATPVAAPLQQERRMAEPDQKVAVSVEASEKVQRRHEPRTRKSGAGAGQFENNGLNLAYLAKREAGDKLGSGAVRPALYHRRNEAEQAAAAPVEESQAAIITQSGQFVPGSTAGLQAALELARSGKPDTAEKSQPDLQNLVASLQARNNVSAGKVVEAQPVEAVSSAAAEPVTRKVRYSTNIPQGNKGKKKADQAIRMLNVDNVGLNSKQGQGLAAYHAAQEAAASAGAQPVAAQPQAMGGQPVAAAPISPLTAASVQETEASGANFAIPPLRGDGLKS